MCNPNLRGLHDLITIAADTGIRSGELQQLEWGGVDFRDKHISIAGSMSPRLRFVPFNSGTLSVLAVRLAEKPGSTFVLGDYPSSLPSRVSRQLSELGNSMGIFGLNLQALRGSFFLALVNSGSDVLISASARILAAPTAKLERLFRSIVAEVYLRCPWQA